MFTARGSVWACWWIAFGVAAGVGLRSADGGEPDAVERALARGEAVFSGRMTYSVASGKSGSGGVPDRYDFTFSGASWKKVWARDAGTVPRSFSKGGTPARGRSEGGAASEWPSRTDARVPPGAADRVPVRSAGRRTNPEDRSGRGRGNGNERRVPPSAAIRRDVLAGRKPEVRRREPRAGEAEGQ